MLQFSVGWTNDEEAPSLGVIPLKKTRSIDFLNFANTLLLMRESKRRNKKGGGCPI